MNTINQLNNLYSQRVWLQIPSQAKRNEIRDTLSLILIKSFENTGNRKEAKRIIESLELENKVFR